jgi:hypothetical protein
VIVRGQLLLVVFMGKDLVVLLPETRLHLWVLVGARLLLYALMSRGLHVVMLHLILLLLMLLVLLWDQPLPGMARAELRVLVLVLVGTNMWQVEGPLVVLMQLLVLARARLLLHGLLDTEL